MAKRAPILPDNYNPVGDRLRRILQPAPAPSPVERDSSEPERVVQSSLVQPIAAPAPAVSHEVQVPIEREPIPEIPTDRELKAVSVRFRCTLSERRKWHEVTRELTGDHNNLSHFIRAAMLLLEHAHEPLKRLAPDIQRMVKPATTDALGITFYEGRLGQYLYDAIRLAGRPKG